jgi:hypothetical protein
MIAQITTTVDSDGGKSNEIIELCTDPEIGVNLYSGTYETSPEFDCIIKVLASF